MPVREKRTREGVVIMARVWLRYPLCLQTLWGCCAHEGKDRREKTKQKEEGRKRKDEARPRSTSTTSEEAPSQVKSPFQLRTPLLQAKPTKKETIQARLIRDLHHLFLSCIRPVEGQFCSPRELLSHPRPRFGIYSSTCIPPSLCITYCFENEESIFVPHIHLFTPPPLVHTSCHVQSVP